MVDKKVKLQLAGLDGNAFALLGAFRKQAKKENWTKEEINKVIKEASSGDYNNLVNVLANHCDEEDDDE